MNIGFKWNNITLCLIRLFISSPSLVKKSMVPDFSDHFKILQKTVRGLHIIICGITRTEMY